MSILNDGEVQLRKKPVIALFFDTETTGFPGKDFKPEIVQIGAILEDTDNHRTLAELCLIIRINEPMPEEPFKVHGIGDDIIKHFGINKSIAEVVFTDLVLRANLLVAHNVTFDMKVIEHDWEHAHAATDAKKVYCTMRAGATLDEIPKRHAGKTKFPSLADSYFHFYGKEIEGAHNALTDARACRDVYYKLIEKLT
jgi:DNA polymerase-3 subunit epsilon